MPLETTTLSPTDLATRITSPSQPITPSGKHYIVFYASPDSTGRSWCGDCRDAEPYVDKKFGIKKEGELALVVYVGSREEWRSTTKKNPWKEEPFWIEKLPTIVKIQAGKWERLVEADVYDQEKLDAFVDT